MYVAGIVSDLSTLCWRVVDAVIPNAGPGNTRFTDAVREVYLIRNEMRRAIAVTSDSIRQATKLG